MSDLKKVITEVYEHNIINLTFSNLFDRQYKYTKINIKKIDNYYQISFYTKTQVFHKNVQSDQLLKELYNYSELYKQIDCKVESGNYNVLINKKNKVYKKFNPQVNKQTFTHNKIKQSLIEDFSEIKVLYDLNILDKNDEVINSKSSKFRQINKYLQYIEDFIKDDNIEEIKIVDFGAGKSYLTFILYYYLTDVKKINAKIIGVDLREDLINSNNKLAKKYHYENLHFISKDINDVKLDNIDMVISLHACDIATDLALYKAIMWKAKYIFAVPCCQNEVYQQINSDNYNSMLKFGVIKERISALFTDTIRANALEYLGYQTQVIEFVDMDHSLKNLMIRSKYNGYKNIKSLENIINLQKEFNFSQKLLELLEIGV